MKTLNLKKQHKGSYKLQTENISITVENPSLMFSDSSKGWQLVIMNSNEELLNEWFSTKKEAIKFGTNWVINNL